MYYIIERKKLNFKKVIAVVVILITLLMLLVKVIITNRSNEEIYTFPDYSKNVVLDGVEIKSIIEDERAYIAVHYPQVVSERINEAVYEMIELEINDFENSILENTSKKRPELYITFETYKYKSKIISFKFEIYEIFPGEEYRKNRIKTMTFDMEKERQITIADLFKDEGYIQILSEKSYNYFSELGINKNNLQALKNGAIPTKEIFKTFILTDDYLELSFNLSKTTGIQTYKIPLGEIKEYLNESILEEQALAEQVTDSEETIVPEQVAIPKEDIEELKDKKLIAITFDDGPDARYTNELLDFLREEDVKATFFVLRI